MGLERQTVLWLQTRMFCRRWTRAKTWERWTAWSSVQRIPGGEHSRQRKQSLCHIPQIPRVSILQINVERKEKPSEERTEIKQVLREDMVQVFVDHYKNFSFIMKTRKRKLLGLFFHWLFPKPWKSRQGYTEIGLTGYIYICPGHFCIYTWHPELFFLPLWWLCWPTTLWEARLNHNVKVFYGTGDDTDLKHIRLGVTLWKLVL